MRSSILKNCIDHEISLNGRVKKAKQLTKSPIMSSNFFLKHLSVPSIIMNIFQCTRIKRTYYYIQRVFGNCCAQMERCVQLAELTKKKLVNMGRNLNGVRDKIGFV